MKRNGILWMALGSLLTVAFNTYIHPFLEIFYQGKENGHVLKAQQVQAKINDIARSEAIKQSEFELPIETIMDGTEIIYVDGEIEEDED